jgi:trimeric autotransporter adhesin
VGRDALLNNTTGYSNTAQGYESLTKNGSGRYNTATGYGSLFANTTGAYNSAVGTNALRSNTTGHYNTAIGYSAGPSSTTPGLSNTTSIGYQAATNASNQVRVGNVNVTSIGGVVSWTRISDGRFKTNVKEDVPGLDFINDLKPVTYDLDKSALGKKLGTDESSEGVPNSAEPRQTGFIAQDVEKSSKKLNYEFSGVDAPKNDQDMYGLRYAEFVVPLVKAVQELSKKTEEQQRQIEELKEIIRRLDGENIGSSDAWIKQNTPNPVLNSTTIEYSIPRDARAARIIFTNAKGQQLKIYNVGGNGVVNFAAGTLPSGTYNYSLIIDGKTVSSRKMVIAR